MKHRDAGMGRVREYTTSLEVNHTSSSPHTDCPAPSRRLGGWCSWNDTGQGRERERGLRSRSWFHVSVYPTVSSSCLSSPAVILPSLLASNCTAGTCQVRTYVTFVLHNNTDCNNHLRQEKRRGGGTRRAVQWGVPVGRRRQACASGLRISWGALPWLPMGRQH